MIDLIPVACVAMVVSALLLPTPADRFRGALGIPAFLLGAASIPSLPAFNGPSLTTWISGGLLLLGPGLLLLAAIRARPRLRVGDAAPWISALGVGAGCAAAWPTLDRGGVLPAVLTAGALGFGGTLGWLVGEWIRLGRAVRWLDQRLPALRGRYSWGTLAFVAGALFFQVALLAWPLWALSWQPVGVGAGVLGVLWAVATGRVSLALAAVAFAAAFTPPEAALGGWSGTLALLVAALAAPSRPRIIALVAAFGAWLVWPALLREEVLLTVLLTAGVTAVLAQRAAQADVGTGPPR